MRGGQGGFEECEKRMDALNFWQLNAAALLVGYVLDLILGDPEGWPHPVVWIGRFISWLEGKLRARGGNLRRSALLLTAATVLLSMFLTAAVLLALSMAHEFARFAGMCAAAWWSLSAKCLAREGEKVRRALGISLQKGREQVARIVGRDTASLSEEEVVCAAVETIAENATDGVIAPMFWFLLGGPVLAMGFKAVSTLDSMVGYLDERYRDIGWSSAKLDDLLNFIPARICGLLLCLSAFFCGLDGRNALRIMRRDHANHLSPNCAWSEGAAAGALHIRLGGTHRYFGKIVEKPSIGDAGRPPQREDIRRANRLLYASSLLMALLAALVGALA